MPVSSVASGSTILDLLVSTGLATSRSEGKRLLEQKAVELNTTVLTDEKTLVEIKSGDILKVGKKKFLKFI